MTLFGIFFTKGKFEKDFFLFCGRKIYPGGTEGRFSRFLLGRGTFVNKDIDRREGYNISVVRGGDPTPPPTPISPTC